jgi:urea transporter
MILSQVEHLHRSSPASNGVLIEYLFTDILFRGFSQIFFVDHPIAGAMIFGAMVIASAENDTRVGLVGYALLGSVVSLLTSMTLLHPTKEDSVMCDPQVTHGCCGYDGGM